MESNFKIKTNYHKITLEKDNNSITIDQSLDDDIWFKTDREKTLIELDSFSMNFEERRIYDIFSSLMKRVIGRFFLSGHYKENYPPIPNDFIDIENKTIRWHSDNENDDILIIQHYEDKIKVSITKDPKSKPYQPNSVRIRTKGSDYEYYYKEFIDFYKYLSDFANSIPTKEEQNHPQKKLSIFRKKV